MFDYRIFNLLLVILTLISNSVTSEVPRPRGVSLSRVPLYSADRDFTCLDGSLTIPFTQVNDDYCDCPDASDEPGTSACPHGIFHCTNAGHKPLNIASSRVNDGICDCCDASDEYHSKTTCANNCKELGRSAREEAQKRAELLKAGKELREELAVKGAQLKQGNKEKLAELQGQKIEAENVLREKENLKKDIESQEAAALELYKAIEEEEKRKREEIETANTRAEATETFAKFDSNRDGRVDISELQTRATFDKDKNGEVNEEEARYFLNEQDALEIEEFITEAWGRVKPYLLMEAGLFKGPVGEGTVEEVPLGRRDEEHEEHHQEEEEEHDEEEPEHEEEEEEEEEEDTQPIDPGVATQAPPTLPQYDAETQHIVDRAEAARADFGEADRAVKNIQGEITRIEEYLQKDFGPEEEFAALEGECFEYTDYEYIYKLCPFDKATQQQKSSSLDTRLGTWTGWLGDDELTRYDTMMYENGQSCWNGPQRSVRVVVTCGSDSRLTGVSEPNRCEYQFDFTTPAACREVVTAGTTAGGGDDVHDEL